MSSSRMIIPSVLLAFLLALAACNTMEGFGQDMQNLGDDIEGEAEEHD